jgi:hypothetical protein
MRKALILVACCAAAMCLPAMAEDNLGKALGDASRSGKSIISITPVFAQLVMFSFQPGFKPVFQQTNGGGYGDAYRQKRACFQPERKSAIVLGLHSGGVQTGVPGNLRGESASPYYSRDRAMMAQRFVSAGLLRPEPVLDVPARIEKGLLEQRSSQGARRP